MTMHIKVLGPGCANCRRLHDHTEAAVADLGIDARIEDVHDLAEIASYGVMRTPGLVVDERLVVSGRVPTPGDIAGMLREAT